VVVMDHDADGLDDGEPGFRPPKHSPWDND
jgi:hypothetical protein